MSEFLVGDHVDVQGLRAIVRYVGETQFMEGEWVGVELLDTPAGKNNGTVRDVQYFTCRDKYGMFVRPSVPRLMERPKQAPKPAQRPTSMGTRPSATAAAAGAAAAPKQPLTKPRSMTMRSPTKPGSPTKGVGSATGTPARGPTPSSSTPATTPRNGTPTQGQKPTIRAPPSRPGSMGPPTAKRQSISSAPAATPGAHQRTASTAPSAMGRTTPSAGKGLSLKAPTGVARKTPASSPGPSETESHPVRQRSDTTSAQMARTASSSSNGARRDSLAPGTRSSTSTSPSRPRQSTAQAQNAELAAAQREAEDLKSKIKILEKKRMEDREKLKTLERVQEEKEKYEAIIQKLQQKYAPQQQEITELRKKMQELEAQVAEMEEAKVENDMILEMAALDREMAEEQSEAYKAELEAVRAKAEELEMEVEILREENEELGNGMTQEEKTSSNWIQLEKQNERLREALIRLREITAQTEDELKETVKSLEEDNTELQKYKDDYEATQERLRASESAVDDLRQQLETALGAEEMLEDLTERNMNMAEQIDELRATVEDLESLKEIADELEINHVETEKQMQEELDYRDFLITEQAKRVALLESNIEEAEYTITRYREVVMSLQNDLEDMRASQQITETESEKLTARSRAMNDLNLKLQITAAKAQNKTIDLELRRLDAEEAMEHLAVVQMFLPESFQADKDSVLALLRFRRVAFKANMLQKFVKERLGTQITNGSDDTVIAACDVCDKLTWVTAMCERFINCINSCSIEQFTRFQGALYELDPVERALNVWIDGLRRDELKEKQCAAELQRTMAVMQHLGEIHLTADLEGFASDIHMRAQLMQSYMDSTAAAVTHIKAMVAEKLPVETPDDEEASSAFIKKADAIISSSRSAKVVVGKVLRSLDDFRQRSLSLTQDKLPLFESCEELTAKLATYTRTLADSLYPYLYSPDAETPSWQDLQNHMFNATTSIITTSDPEIFGPLSKELRALGPQLTDLASLAADIDSTAEFERAPPPWQARAEELKQTKTHSVDVEDELRRLKDALIERATQLKLRDQALDESHVKIELLESRMHNITKQAARIAELESLLAASDATCKSLADTIESLTEDIQHLDDELEKAKKALEIRQTHATAAGAAAAPADYQRALATTRELRAAKSELAALRSAVSHLRAENRTLRLDTSAPHNAWLLEPLCPTQPAARDTRVHREAKDVLDELRRLVTEEKVLRFPDAGARAGWRPQRQSLRWQVERQKERFEEVRAWKEEVLARMRGRLVLPRGEGAGVLAAKAEFPARWGGEVRVRDPEVWEEVQELLET